MRWYEIRKAKKVLNRIELAMSGIKGILLRMEKNTQPTKSSKLTKPKKPKKKS